MGDRRQVVFIDSRWKTYPAVERALTKKEKIEKGEWEEWDENNQASPPENMLEGNCIVLYTHWGGSEMGDNLAGALDHQVTRSRWCDPNYLTRILISRLIGDDHESETGWGLAPTILDSEYRDFIVDTVDHKVTIARTEASPWRSVDVESYSFEEFIALSKAGRRFDEYKRDPEHDHPTEGLFDSDLMGKTVEEQLIILKQHETASV